LGSFLGSSFSPLSSKPNMSIAGESVGGIYMRPLGVDCMYLAFRNYNYLS
jgi:hypothetical protein